MERAKIPLNCSGVCVYSSVTPWLRAHTGKQTVPAPAGKVSTGERGQNVSPTWALVAREWHGMQILLPTANCCHGGGNRTESRPIKYLSACCAQCWFSGLGKICLEQSAKSTRIVKLDLSDRSANLFCFVCKDVHHFCSTMNKSDAADITGRIIPPCPCTSPANWITLKLAVARIKVRISFSTHKCAQCTEVPCEIWRWKKKKKSVHLMNFWEVKHRENH